MNEMCRTCLSESKEVKLINVFNKMIGTESILEFVIKFASVKAFQIHRLCNSQELKYVSCANFFVLNFNVLSLEPEDQISLKSHHAILPIIKKKVLNNDPLPKVICSICLDKVYLFHSFRQIILDSDKTLKKKLSDGNTSLKPVTSCKVKHVIQSKHILEAVDQLSNDESNDKSTTIKQEKEFESRLPKYLDEDTNNSVLNPPDIGDKNNLNNSNFDSHLDKNTPLIKQKNGRRMYECKDCNKLFKKADHYKVHMTKHTGEKKYACEFCPKRFARSYVLLYHRRVHTGERPYSCNICSKSFSSPSNFYIHKKIHSGEKNYKCQLCDESFIQLDSLKIHIRRIHTGERPFLCEICSSTFRSNSSLLTHKLDMHGEKEACPVCSKSYSSRVLKEHIRRHKEKEQGIKRYACDQCGKRFTCSSSRKKHLLIHSGEKPYSCEICEKSFNQRSALKTHMRVHSDFMPFQCDLCPKSFRHKHHLRSHNNTHHKEVLKEEINSDN